jgi:hypothetical protein
MLILSTLVATLVAWIVHRFQKRSSERRAPRDGQGG